MGDRETVSVAHQPALRQLHQVIYLKRRAESRCVSHHRLRLIPRLLNKQKDFLVESDPADDLLCANGPSLKCAW
jgi:hypothetical protein